MSVTRAEGPLPSPSNVVEFPRHSAAADPATLPSLTTDVANAHRLVEQHGQDLRYCAKWGEWLVWDDTRWHRDETGEVMRHAKDTVRSIYHEAGTADDSGQRRELAGWAKRSESVGRLRAMIHLAESEPGIAVTPDQLDQAPMLLTVLNGTLDLRTGELRDHCRDDLITKLAPVGYDPEAPCPRWLAFLERIFDGNAELIAFVQRAIGYTLTGRTDEQVLFLLYGTGANGKTTLLETLRALLGDYAQQADFRTLLARDRDNGPRNDIARMAGARYIAAAEVEDGRRLSEAIVKQLTGGDTIAARFLHQEHFEFQMAGKLWLAVNRLPTIRGTEHAIWRRIRLIPFNVTIQPDQQDRHLLETLRGELPGILNWALQGCLSWRDYGLGESQAVQQATNDYRADMDVLGNFVTECCKTSSDDKTSSADLYKAYTAWCADSGEKPLPTRTFSVRLQEHFDTQKQDVRLLKKSGQKVWSGLALRGPRG